MNRRLFVFVIILMGISLAGIILLQLFWIRNAISIREDQFDRAVNLALDETAEKLESHENIMLLSDRIGRAGKNDPSLDASEDILMVRTDTSSGAFSYNIRTDDQSNYVISITNDNKDGRLVEYKHGIRIDSLKKKVSLVKSLMNTDSLSKVITHDILFVNESGDTLIEGSDNSFMIIKKANDLSEAFVQMAYEIESDPLPIHQRIDPAVLTDILRAQMFDKGISAPFEFAVMRMDSARSFPIQSDGFNTGKLSFRYIVNLFPNELVDESNFLVIQFQGRNVHILRSMAWVLAASLLLTLVILATFGITIFMILRQKKLSDIKSDFINNMTHEFKTPIATISLAVDSIDNPSIIGNEKEIRYYTEIIREENKRMNTQVESVLRLSLLDRHELEFNCIETDVHELIRRAVSKVGLLLKEKNGIIKVETNAENPVCNVDPDHFTNALLNILDNAIKYTQKEPVINLSTENTPAGLRVSIEDNGVGMSRETQQKIFDKFYRKSSGNIHDIKGFGLGLSYVKAVVEAFGGSIHAKSEQGKGSIFELNIPLL
jgi:two-component system phosphate regulon sensor histidine kinase PhoR